MARTIAIEGRVDMSRDSAVEDTFQTKLTGKSITSYHHSVVVVGTDTQNQNVPFPTGLTTAKYLHLLSSGSTMTYSLNTTSTHHRLEDGGFVSMNGNFTSLCLSNNTTLTGGADNTVTVILAG